MSREEKLGWASLLLGIVSLVPSLLLIFTEWVVLGVLVLVFAFGLIGVFVWLRWFLEQPDFTLLDVSKTLTFQDKDAHRATHVDTRKVRANHKGITEFWFRGIGTDGSIENILINDKEPDCEQVRAGLKEVCKRFSSARERGDEFKVTSSFDAIDSFYENSDFHTYKVSSKTKKARITINFHREKPCHSAKVYLQYGSSPYKLLKTAQLKRSEDGREVELEIRNPKLGAEYRLEWRW